MKKLLLLALLPCVSYAGTFKPLSEGRYEFSGEMVMADVTAYKELILKEPSLTVYVDSDGGALAAGIQMAEVTFLCHEKIQLIARGCLSAAAVWVAADPGFKYEDKDSYIGFHLAWLSFKGLRVEQTDGRTSRMAMELFLCLYRTQGESAIPLFKKMCDARDKLGVNGFVVRKKDGSEKTQLWTGGFKDEAKPAPLIGT